MDLFYILNIYFFNQVLNIGIKEEETVFFNEALHLWKADLSIAVLVDGMIIFFNEMHFSNANSLILFNTGGNTTSSSKVQLEKHDSLIVSTKSGIIIFFNDLHSKKQEFPM